jgi:hypothetical protein
LALFRLLSRRLTVHILAAVAQHEREMISERTKAALQAAKKRGQRLGNPGIAEAAKLGALRCLSRYYGYDAELLGRAYARDDDPPPSKADVDLEYRRGLAAHIFNCTAIYPT